MAQLALWNGDICDLEVDAIVSPANVTMWMSTGVGGAIKRRGGEEIEFAAVRQAPVPIGGAILTGAGTLAARWVIHAVSLDSHRRTSSKAIAGAVRSAIALARELELETLAIPALGTGVGGFPLEEAARITVNTVRAEIATAPRLATVTFALRGAAAYHAFVDALAASAPTTPASTGRPA